MAHDVHIRVVCPVCREKVAGCGCTIRPKESIEVRALNGRCRRCALANRSKFNSAGVLLASYFKPIRC